tara:strand:+ start:463 stop:939 length:477 start_codon:yes stop_codon:yes gene_type:complete
MFFGLKLGQAMVYAGLLFAFASAFQFSGSVGEYFSFAMTDQGQARMENLTWMIILVGTALQVYRTYAEGKEKERAADRAENRRGARDSIDPTARMYIFAEEMLGQPISAKEIQEASFSGDAKRGIEDLRADLVVATADQCVLTGLATIEKGKYRQAEV